MDRAVQVYSKLLDLQRAGFNIRAVHSYPDHFLVSTDHGGEGATSRWSSSWVRRYTYDG